MVINKRTEFWIAIIEIRNLLLEINYLAEAKWPINPVEYIKRDLPFIDYLMLQKGFHHQSQEDFKFNGIVQKCYFD